MIACGKSVKSSPSLLAWRRSQRFGDSSGSRARRRDVGLDEQETVKLIDDLIDSLTPPHLSEAERARAFELVWSLQPEASLIQQAEDQIESLRDDVWEPFERCARVLDHFGYLDF